MKLFSIEEMREALKMADVLAALRTLYAEVGSGRTANRVRSDTICATPAGDIYGLKSMDGVVPSLEVGAIRINSDVVTWPTRGGYTRREKVPAAPGQRWVGLILLFSTRTGEPLAIMPDGYIQRMRVGGTSGLAVDCLARSDAHVLGLFGTGWQAGAQLLAACSVRDIHVIRVYSPNPEHRVQFAAQMRQELGREIELVDRPQAVVREADVVLCATNSIDPLFSEEWLAPGMHVGCIRHCEISERAYEKMTSIVLHTHDAMPLHVVVPGVHVPELDENKGWADPHGTVDWASLPTLDQLVHGDIQGRASADDITCFLNNIGMGVQFAAVGAKLLELTAGTSIGRDLPTEWFTQNVHP